MSFLQCLKGSSAWCTFLLKIKSFVFFFPIGGRRDRSNQYFLPLPQNDSPTLLALQHGRPNLGLFPVFSVSNCRGCGERAWKKYRFPKFCGPRVSHLPVSLSTKVCLIKAMVFPVVIYGCELDYKESWVPKNWCFWTVVLEKIVQSPLDCKEIQPVHPKGNQSWLFIGRTDAEAETPILWPPDAKSWLIWKDWCWERLRAGGEEDDRGWDSWMASLTQWQGFG